VAFYVSPYGINFGIERLLGIGVILAKLATTIGFFNNFNSLNGRSTYGFLVALIVGYSAQAMTPAAGTEASLPKRRRGHLFG